ncbi:MAG: Flp family type IVb pilin [Methylovirgula sp.]
MKTVMRFATDESGATAIEYGLIAVVIISSVRTLGTRIATKFNIIASNLS